MKVPEYFRVGSNSAGEVCGIQGITVSPISLTVLAGEVFCRGLKLACEPGDSEEAISVWGRTVRLALCDP